MPATHGWNTAHFAAFPMYVDTSGRLSKVLRKANSTGVHVGPSEPLGPFTVACDLRGQSLEMTSYGSNVQN